MTEDMEGKRGEGNTDCKRLMLELRDVGIPQAGIKVKHVKKNQTNKTVQLRKRWQTDLYERVVLLSSAA